MVAAPPRASVPTPTRISAPPTHCHGSNTSPSKTKASRAATNGSIVAMMLARDGAPAYVPMLICDHVAGEIAAGAILAAVVERKSSGAGCSLEVPMFGFRDNGVEVVA